MADFVRFSAAESRPAVSSASDDEPASGQFSRRFFLTGACAAVLLGPTVFTAPSASARAAAQAFGSDDLDPDHHGVNTSDSLGADRGRRSVASALGFLRAATNAYPAVNPGPRLARSYADQLGLFSTAFVYDNALAVCAAIAGGPEYEDLNPRGVVGGHRASGHRAGRT